MIVKTSETKSLTANNTTVDALLINVYALMAAVNNPIDSDDFDPSQVTIKLELRTDEGLYTICNDNLKVLGQFATLKTGNTQWNNGVIINPAALAVKEDVLFPALINFGHINLKANDSLTCQVVCGRSTYSSEVDTAISYVEFSFRESIGYEMGIPQIRTEVIQANITNQKLALGDNVTNIAFLNFDKTSYANNVLSNLTLRSDKLQQTFNFFDLVTKDLNEIGFHNDFQVTGVNGFKKYPQSLAILLQDTKEPKDLDNTFVDMAFNSGNVAASQNYVAWHSLVIVKDRISRVLDMAANHQQKNIAKIS